ncbi:hypothetical protein ACGF3C_25250 [Micromonospora sp. NPDC047762]|uniref:hypothetical protein n=1 Tax=Micromonospora sp. NPDC047762 TaxID=3364255 RepID=UPI00371A905C
MKPLRSALVASIGLVLVLAVSLVLHQRTLESVEPGLPVAAGQAAETAPANPRWRLNPDGTQADEGVSRVQAPNTGDQVRVREWPQGNNAGQTQGFGIIDELDAGSQVVMKCWTDTSAPRDGTSRRWFWVVEAPSGSPHPGVTGYVWSDLVWDQIRVPKCDASMTRPVDPLKHSVVALTQGKAAPSGYFYAVRLSAFPPGWHATVQCMDDNDPDVFKSFDLVVNADGAAARDDGCYSGDSGGHWVNVWGVESEHVTWPTSVASPALPTSGADDEPPASADGPRPETPARQEPSGPATRTLLVQNLVTNGATAMREDKPAYLSSRTEPTCQTRGCALEGTNMSTGARIVATCQLDGSTITNGQNNSPNDDANPGLFSSSLWYGVRWSDGRSGYLSEVWIQPDGRGGLGLPHC